MSSPSHFGLPPSSVPGGTPDSSLLPQSRPIIDPLAFDNVHGLGGSLPGGTGNAAGAGGGRVDEAIDTETGEAVRRGGGGGRRARLEDTNDIPRVKDATGEKVMESFALFLEK